MGPNGSGKSSLAYALMGHPRYHVSSKKAIFLHQKLQALSPQKRAKLGLFLSFQHPCEIPGATVFSVLKEAYSAKTEKLVSVGTFTDILFENMDLLKIDHSFAYRGLNEGFSGGEKKRFEILQMLLLKPKLAILDEIDSGLDVDAIKIVAQGIAKLRAENPEMSLLIITHHRKILKHLAPNFVHVMHAGKIIRSGDSCLIKQIEQSGYNEFIHV